MDNREAGGVRSTERDSKLVCNEVFKIHSSLMLISGAQLADMLLLQKYLNSQEGANSRDYFYNLL